MCVDQLDSYTCFTRLLASGRRCQLLKRDIVNGGTFAPSMATGYEINPIIPSSEIELHRHFAIFGHIDNFDSVTVDLDLEVVAGCRDATVFVDIKRQTVFSRSRNMEILTKDGTAIKFKNLVVSSVSMMAGMTSLNNVSRVIAGIIPSLVSVAVVNGMPSFEIAVR